MSLEGAPVKGDAEAPLTIIELIGTQCPACANFTKDSWRQVKEDLIDEGLVRYISKVLPVGEDKEEAKQIANAMLCANDQGKYFEYLSEFYFFDGEMNKDILIRTAGAVGLGETEFELCLDEKRFDETTTSFVAELGKLGINTVPTYIIGNKIHNGPLSFEKIEQLVDNELQRRGVAGEVGVENMNDEPVLGEEGIEIQVYSDFDCTSCRLDWEMLSEAADGLAVRLVFSNLPDPAHPYSQLAAVAGECAVSQGNFWEYMNLMFDNQEDLRRTTLERLGTQIGFGGDFQNCVRANETLPEVQYDMEAAQLAGIEKTPTYVVDGEVVEAPDSVEGWKSLINEKL
jgi:protein-disulfide isomerase